MSRPTPFFLSVILASSSLAFAAEEEGLAELESSFKAPVPEAEGKAGNFQEIFSKIQKEAARKGPDLDRTRGQIVFKAEEGTYLKNEHFGRWNWPEFTPDRWGKYDVEVTYVSISPKMGFQFYVGDAKSKGYAPQSGGMEIEHTTMLSPIYIPNTNSVPVGVLSGNNSNGASFQLRKVVLTPAPEGDSVSQGIDGTITLAASNSTTYSKKMRYEPKTEKNCLGFWTDENDFAEWSFEVHAPGEFQVQVFQGCGDGNGGSEVGFWVNEEQRKFMVKETGGFQNWKPIDLGTIKVSEGSNTVTIKPLNKTNKAVMDIQKVVLTPVG
tara:strand:+ start:18567 stop:19538 length:972 start_codon:yes stop_codon:yes gene_type:complete